MEKPILFSAPMARAILDGRKTMTRRVLKPQPSMPFNAIFYYPGEGWFTGDGLDGARNAPRLRVPYAVGDTLWVRERFLPDAPETGAGWDDEGLSFVEWDGCGRRLDGVPKIYRKPEYCIFAADPKWSSATDWKWRPSIHMPRWASRLTLRVTAVKVERLQDISEADARAEGCGDAAHPDMAALFSEAPGAYAAHMATGGIDPVTLFEILWESINGPGSWDANPWVASYSFERVT